MRAMPAAICTQFTWRNCIQKTAQSKWMRPRLKKTASASTMRIASQTMPLRLFIGLLSSASFGLLRGRHQAGVRGTLAAVELADDAGNVGARLGVGRNAVVAIDRRRARVVGGD